MSQALAPPPLFQPALLNLLCVKCASVHAYASLHLSLYAYISCVNMCVCTGSVALAACTEEDTGEEGQQEELERLYSTIYQLDAQVYRKV